MSQFRCAPAAALAITAFVLGVVAATTIQSTSQGQVTVTSAAPPAMSPPSAAAVGYQADVIRVMDGDTFEARVRIWPGLEITTKVRLRGIDAPELRAQCVEERVRAEAARAALSALLAQGRVGISQVSLDKYGGRVVADASARNTASLAEALVTAGHVRRYGGGRREGWCGRS